MGVMPEFQKLGATKEPLKITPFEELRSCEEKLAHWAYRHYDEVYLSLKNGGEYYSELAEELHQIVRGYTTASHAYAESCGKIDPATGE